MEPVTRARVALGLNSTDLAVLRAILAFIPREHLSLDQPEAHVCFAGNIAISERIGSSGDSTVNRALRRLEGAGLLHRKPSANRKRFAIRGRGGAILHAYGIDLAPMIERCAELTSLMEVANRDHDRLCASHLRCKLLLAELHARHDEAPSGSAIKTDALLAQARRLLRQKPRHEALDELRQDLEKALDASPHPVKQPPHPPHESEAISNTDSQNERHIETEKENSDSVTYEQIKKTFPTLQSYIAGITDADEISKSIDILICSLGDTAHSWRDCKIRLGSARSFLLASFIFENLNSIRNPGGFIRTLTGRIASGALSIATLLSYHPMSSPQGYRLRL